MRFYPKITHTKSRRPSFEWIGFSIGEKTVEKAAIVIPMKLDHSSKVFWMQLDTGSDASIIYGIPFNQINYDVKKVDGRDDLIMLNGTLGSYALNNTRFLIWKDYGDPLEEKEKYPVIGTVGQDLLVNKVLLVDFPNKQFYLTDAIKEIPQDLLEKAYFVDLIARDNKLFVKVQLADMISEDFFYDTGSSMFPISTTKELWQKLTGRKPDEKDNIQIRIPSWGKEAVSIGAPLKGALKFGELEVMNPLIYYEATGLIDFSEWPFKVDGLIGNALFYDDYTIILDLIQNRFGIIQND